MFENDINVLKILKSRNNSLSPFWFANPDTRKKIEPVFLGKRLLIVDAEDTFTGMLSTQLSSLGFNVTIKNHNHVEEIEHEWDLIVMGPGPGDPTDKTDQRIALMKTLMTSIRKHGKKFFAVCLSHQILSIELGLNLCKKTHPNQGIQKEIELFGKKEKVGFYNTYASYCDQNAEKRLLARNIQVARDNVTNEVYALRGSKFASVQFHPESILTQNGVHIITSYIQEILNS